MIEVKGITIDIRWKWMAKDDNGVVYVYEDIPVKREHTWEREKISEAYRLASIYPIELNSIPWDQSLHEIWHTEDGLILMPWRPNLVVDDPVMVRNCENEKWTCRHFAKWGLRGELLTWENGTTSFTSLHGFTAKWVYYRLPTPEELNRNANHK